MCIGEFLCALTWSIIFLRVYRVGCTAKFAAILFFFGYNVLPNSVEVFTIRVYSHTQAGRLIHKFFPSNVLDESDKMFEFKPLREAFLLSVEG